MWHMWRRESDMYVAIRKPFSVGLVSLCAVIGALAFTSAPAFAAAPETPTLTVEEPVHATGATLHGVLNPGKEGEPGTYEMDEYEFVYKASKTKECKGGSTAPVPPGLSLGGGKEEVTQPLEGLTKDTEYAVCLVVHNAAKTEKAVTPAVTFKTAIAPEAPDDLKAEPVTTTTATLHGVLNPKAPGNPGTYEFLYRQSATECEGGEASGGSASGGKGEAPELELTSLPRGTTYTFCLRARNEAGEEALSAPVTFTTLSSPPMIVSESVSTVEATAATLEAKIKPEGAATTYRFEYLTEAQFKASGKTFTGATATPESESIGADEAEHPVSVRLKGLAPATTYDYQVVAESKVAGKTEVIEGSAKTLTTREGPTAIAETCPNKQRRAEQPFGLGLPDCRAYEMVSPVNTEGENATEEEYDQRARAAEEGAAAQPTTEPTPAQEGGAVTYVASGPFSGTAAEPLGATLENQYVSRRDPEHDDWTTQAVTPLHDPKQTDDIGSYTHDAFNPQLTEGLAYTNAPLTEGAPHGSALYAANFADGSYRYITNELSTLPLGVSSDLSHVVFGEFGVVSEWAGGTPFPVGVTNNENNGKAELVHATVAGWRAVSAAGSDVAFVRGGQLYVRVNAGQPQSPLEEPEAEGSGTLTEGSNTMSELTAASGTTVLTSNAGSTELELIPMDGRFVVGETVSGSGVEPGTTITAIQEDATAPEVTLPEPEEILTLSKPTEGEVPSETVVSSGGPAPFVVGDRISGAGIPVGTTVTGAAEGSLTLSAEATASETGEQLVEGGGCTVSTDACTVEASASHRLAENPVGARPAPAQYWGASVDGSRVFFSSTAELTEDAYTGAAGEGANLYEFEPGTNTLTDLTASDHSGAGADVQGVVGISEDGSYVYFVADGALAGEAREGEPNLYVIHDGRGPTFITTLGAEDSEVWDTSLESDLASLSPNGEWLAFLSKTELESKTAGLTKYDNAPAHESECQNGHCQEAYLYDAASGRLVCASCNPTGARPMGPANLGESREGPSLYRPRVVTDEGRLFFGSFDKLVPGANGLQNVYEYEEGSIHPISNVSGGYGSFLLDTSASGGDVFFATSDQLLPQDKSNNVVVYDARVDGGFPIPPTAPSCDSGDSCKPPESAQPSAFAPTGSATFNGLGNFSAPPPPAVVKPKPKKKTVKCKKPKKLSRGKCVKPKKKTTAKKTSDHQGRA
jgi:hypothetical protein